MATGTVKWFNDAKGFGFITPGWRWRRSLRAFLRDQHAGLQDAEGRPEGLLRSHAGPEGQASQQHPGCLTSSAPSVRFDQEKPGSPGLFFVCAVQNTDRGRFARLFLSVHHTTLRRRVGHAAHEHGVNVAEEGVSLRFALAGCEEEASPCACCIHASTPRFRGIFPSGIKDVHVAAVTIFAACRRSRGDSASPIDLQARKAEQARQGRDATAKVRSHGPGGLTVGGTCL